MASTQDQSAHVDLFDSYFRRADLDRDGQISGNEAVAFFQGSGLPKQVLAQLEEGHRRQLLLLMPRKSSRPISGNPEHQNWRNIL
ncbi:unnamed protein product [Malus baccata var. baccata]